jgi:hypothetical protein
VGTLGGGLGEGIGIGLTLDLDLERLASPPRSVDVDDEDDSLTGASPRDFPFASSVYVLVTSGRLRMGLGCFDLDAEVETKLGEIDDMEVGVELMLNGPGE